MSLTDPPEITSDHRAQPKMLPPSQAALQALEHTRSIAMLTNQAVDKLVDLFERYDTPPEFRTIVINEGNTGRYTTLDKTRFEAKSIGIVNPNAAAVYVGVGGVSATPTSRAISCPPQAFMTLPVLARDLEVGCDPTVLLASTAVVFLFRFLTVQPLKLGKLT